MDPLSLRNLVRGQLFDLKTPDRRKAMRILKTTPGVTQASLLAPESISLSRRLRTCFP